MSDVTILHNRNCSTSRFAMDAASAAGVSADVVEYLKKPLDAVALRELIDKLEDPATDLVRRDAYFAQVGLGDSDVQTREQVVAVLVEHPRLMQRPVIVKGDRAIIGRPKGRVAEFLSS